MKYKKFTEHFSIERISKYVIATGNNKAKTMMLYKANIAVSQSFIPLICVLEVALRNNINAVLTAHFGKSNWILTEKSGFMNDPRLKHYDKKTGKLIDNRYHLKQVESAEKGIRKDKRNVVPGRVIAEQTFGFWTSFFSSIIYKILCGVTIHAFSNRPTSCQRSLIFDSLEQIRAFRNRISHHEPICFNKAGQKDFSEANRIHNLIKEVLTWIDPDMMSFLKEIDYVDDTIKRMDSKYNNLP